MPSPFPGMDPYLEGELWQEFHETLASAIRAQLMPRLAQKYVALLAKRYTLDRPALGVFDAPPPRVIYPDVHVVAPPIQPPHGRPPRRPHRHPAREGSSRRRSNCPASSRCRNSVSRSAT